MKNEVTASFTWPVAGNNATYHMLPNGFRQNKTAVWPGAGTVTRIQVETSSAAPVTWNQLTVHNCHTNYKKVPTFSVPLDADVDNGAMEVGTFSTQRLHNDNVALETFTVTYRGATTAALAMDVSAANLQAALEGLSTIGAGNVVVAGTNVSTDPYRIVLRRVPGSRPFELLTITDSAGLTSTIAQLPSFNPYGAGTVTGITLANCVDWDSKAFLAGATSLPTTETYVLPMTFEMCVPCPYGILVRGIASADLTAAVRVNVTYIPGTSGWRYFNESRFALAG